MAKYYIQIKTDNRNPHMPDDGAIEHFFDDNHVAEGDTAESVAQKWADAYNGVHEAQGRKAVVARYPFAVAE